MEILRELIYEERNRLDDFDVNKMSSLNYLVYEDWLLSLTDLHPLESGYLTRRLKVFNDTYYISTLILMHKTSECFLRYAYNRCDVPSVVFPMVYLYISKIKDRGKYNTRLLKTIKTAIYDKGWGGNLEKLESIINEKYTGYLSQSVFSPRKLTPDILSDIKWYKATGGFKEDDTLKILKYIAKNQEEWIFMLDAIKNAASEYEYEYNQTLDYVDDDGNWCKEMPLDLGLFYDFCDGIRDKYEEYMMPLTSEEQFNVKDLPDSELDSNSSKPKSVKIGRPKAKKFEVFLMRNTPSCFMSILHEMLDGKTGKDAARIIRACVGLWISKPQIKSVTNEFESIKHNSFSTAFTNLSLFTTEELEIIRKEIRKKMRQNTHQTNAKNRFK